MLSTDEEWIGVVGFEGYYQVSSKGVVRSLDRITTNGSPRRGRILKTTALSSGHLTVSLYRGSKRHHRQVHRLVCEAFHGPSPEGKPYVLHWDDDPANNSKENLRWGDQVENMQDADRNGRIARGISNRDSCPQGHLYNEENSFFRKNRTSRECRTCMRDRARRDYHDKRRTKQ